MNYLLIGPEEYLKQLFLEKLKKSILKNDKSSCLNVDVFRGGEKDFSRVSDALNTAPFLSEKRLVIVRDVDKLPTKERKLILEYLKSPVNSTTLVLESPSAGFKGCMEELSGFTKVIRCDSLKEGELNAWIKKEFTARRKNISPVAVNLLREASGNDLSFLKNEVEKMTSFLGDENELTPRHIEAALGKSATRKTAFDLVKLILDGRPDEAIRLADNLLVKEKPHQILNLLAWQFRNFTKMERLPKRITQDSILRAFEVILEGDFFIKSGKLDAGHALERVLLLLCQAHQDL